MGTRAKSWSIFDVAFFRHPADKPLDVCLRHSFHVHDGAVDGVAIDVAVLPMHAGFADAFPDGDLPGKDLSVNVRRGALKTAKRGIDIVARSSRQIGYLCFLAYL